MERLFYTLPLPTAHSPLPFSLILDGFRGAAPARRRGSGSGCGFGGRRSCGRLRFADAQRGADFGLDLVAQRGVVAERVLGVVAPLAQPLALVRVPRAGLVDDLVLDADVDQLAEFRDPLAVHDVELGLSERRRDFVFDDFDLGAIPYDVLAVLDLRDPADVEAQCGIELQRASAGGRFRRAEHDAYLLANLIDEDQTGVRPSDDRREFPQRLRHQARLQPRKAVAHVAFEFGAGSERGHRVYDQRVYGVRPHQRFADLQRLLARIGLRDEQVVDVDAELLGVDGVERVFGVDVGRDAARLLRLGHDVQRQRGFAGAFRAEDFDDAPARQPADSDSRVEADARSRDHRHVFGLVVAEAHDSALAELLFNVEQSRLDGLSLFTFFHCHRFLLFLSTFPVDREETLVDG